MAKSYLKIKRNKCGDEPAVKTEMNLSGFTEYEAKNMFDAAASFVKPYGGRVEVALDGTLIKSEKFGD